MSEVAAKVTVIDGMSGVLNSMYRGVSQLVAGMEHVQKVSKNAMDTSAFIEAQKSMAESVTQMKLMEDAARRVQEENRHISQTVKAAFSNIEAAQSSVTNNALGMKLLPANAANDINNINTRISNLGNAIANMEAKRNKFSKWDNAGINRYNSEIENMRNAMKQIESIQNGINRAVADNDINSVNFGYSRLNTIVSSVEKSIRDNTSEQYRFNNAVASGTNTATQMASRLQNGINRYVTMAATAFGGKQLIDASDTSIGNSARLGLITDSYAQQLALQQQIYQSAKNARGIYSDTVDTVAKLGLLAGDAFNNNAEVVKFSELMQKSFALSGASTMEKQSAMYQLTQAMSAGKLQGDEFRSIMENAPMLAQAIADFTGKSKGELKEMSAEGTITADIIKGAMFSAADDIEQKYETLPMQFGDAWNGIVSDAQVAFQPVFEMMNNALNSGIGQGMLSGITENIQWLSQLAQEAGTWIQDMVIQAGPALSQLQNTVRGIGSQFLGVNGVVNQVSQNILRAFNNGGAASIRVYASAVGNIAVSLSNVLNVISPLLPHVTSLYIGFKMYQGVSGFLLPIIDNVKNIGIAFVSTTTAVQGASTAVGTFTALCNSNAFLSVAGMIMSIASAWISVGDSVKYAANTSHLMQGINGNALNQGFGNATAIETMDVANKYGVDTSAAQHIANIKKQYDEKRTQLSKERQAANNYINAVMEHGYGVLIQGVGYINKMDEEKKRNFIFSYGSNLSEINLEETEAISQYIKAYKDSKQQIDALNNITPDKYKSDGIIDVGNVDNVNHINDTVDIASEDLKYMRELADQETINQFTSKLLQPSINVTFGEVKETADVDEIISKIVDGITESANNSSDLVHIF